MIAALCRWLEGRWHGTGERWRYLGRRYCPLSRLSVTAEKRMSGFMGTSRQRAARLATLGSLHTQVPGEVGRQVEVLMNSLGKTTARGWLRRIAYEH